MYYSFTEMETKTCVSPRNVFPFEIKFQGNPGQKKCDYNVISFFGDPLASVALKSTN